MTLNEIQAKLEAGVEGSTVTMEGDGCNCSTLLYLLFLKVCRYWLGREWYWHLYAKILIAVNYTP